MNTFSLSVMDDLSAARRKVEIYCQSLVEAGSAHWLLNNRGKTELHLEGGEAYLFSEHGLTWLRGSNEVVRHHHGQARSAS